MRLFIAIAVIAVLSALAALAFLPRAQSGPNSENALPYIVTTTAQIGDLARHVAGDTARVESLMGEGTDPHLYRPTRADRVRLQQADIIMTNGLHLEGKMIELLEKLAEEKPVIEMAQALPPSDILQTASAAHDPHIWMDVSNWIAALGLVERTLSERYPNHSDLYRANAGVFENELKALDDYARKTIGSIPPGQRALVTAHDAFGYMGAAYGLEVFGIQGISTDSEAGLHHIEELVSLIVERKIPAVFVESSVSERNIRALIEGAAARGHAVKIGGELFSDAMGAPGTYEGTYIGMIDHNVTVIAHALGGNAPERGMKGELSHAIAN